MAWLFWLLAPLTAISVTAVLTWWAGRVPKPVTLERAVNDHRLYLNHLADATDTASSAVVRTTMARPERQVGQSDPG